MASSRRRPSLYGQSYPEALKLAKKLQAGPKLAVRWTKHSINKLLLEQYNLTFDTALALEMVTLLTEDHGEAVSAFLQKRKPDFSVARPGSRELPGSGTDEQ